MTDDKQQQGGNADSFQRINPAYVKLDEPEAQPGYREPESAMSTGILLWGLLGLLCLGGAVFLWLPGQVAEREQSAAPPPQAPAAASSPPPAAAASQAESNDTPAPDPQSADEPDADADAPTASTAADADALLEQREAAEAVRAEVVEMRDALEQQGAPRWAAQAWQGLNHLVDKGDREMSARNYELASLAFEEARASAVKITDSRETVFEQAMTRGREQLDQGDYESAVKSFEMAAAVRPDNAEAARLMERAGKRGEVLEFMRQGRNLETAEDMVGARDAYDKAVELDAEYNDARQARARVQGLINDRVYRARLSEGLQELEQGNLTQARETLESAGRLRPDSVEVEDALSRINTTLQARQVDGQRQAGRQAEQAERWEDAEAAYQAALQADPSLQFAQEGQARAAERAALDSKLAYHLQNTGRLSEPAVRQDVARLLAEAKQLPAPREKLDAQTRQLAQALEQAQTPVPVALTSDNQTVVAIHHVGELGTFADHSLELRPGDYTAVGRREGYRDVRREFTVAPGAETVGPIRIVCQERI